MKSWSLPSKKPGLKEKIEEISVGREKRKSFRKFLGEPKQLQTEKHKADYFLDVGFLWNRTGNHTKL